MQEPQDPHRHVVAVLRNTVATTFEIDCDDGVVAVVTDRGAPKSNALGVEEGGSGVPIDREAYRRSVEFWEANANWRP